ncbi:hypothetical protein [Streptomyces sp. MAR4 CNX-425]|uniref:hypothetical protein n=1 Tax=Streptomyces sp. MAR4 CNX-425 TaxID=3406343 RepID=UPI003B50368A
MRKVRAALIAFTSAIALLGGVLAAAPAAQAGTTWKAHDRNCEEIPGGVSPGTVCVNVQKRVTDSGSVTGYRGRVHVTPAEGQWLQPLTYSWTSGGSSQVCPDGCTRKTSSWTSSWSPVNTSAAVYKVEGASPTDRWDVMASWSPWVKLAGKCDSYRAGKFCVTRLQRQVRDEWQQRGSLTVVPASGMWIAPRWVRTGMDNDDGRVAKTKDLCDPSCTRRTSKWNTTVTTTEGVLIGGPYEYFATARVLLPSGDLKTIKATLSG